MVIKKTSTRKTTKLKPNTTKTINKTAKPKTANTKQKPDVKKVDIEKTKSIKTRKTVHDNRNKEKSPYPKVLITNKSEITKEHVDRIANLIEETMLWETEGAAECCGIEEYTFKDFLNRSSNVHLANYANMKIKEARSKARLKMHQAITDKTTSISSGVLLKYLERKDPKLNINMKMQMIYELTRIVQNLKHFEGRVIDQQFFKDYLDLARNDDSFGAVEIIDNILTKLLDGNF